jgi:superfamily II DNA or RNA helicase
MKVTISNKIKVENYNFALIDWCSKNLVVNNPEFYIAEKMGRYTRNIPEKLYIYESNSHALLIPFGSIKKIWPIIKDSPIILDFADPKTNNMKGHINLYPYQERALELMKSAKNGILQAPCGSGKTQIGLALIKSLNMKALWLTHTTDLLIQSKKRAESYFDGDFGTITDGKISIGNDITFATVQTMNKIDLNQYKYEWDVIIVDECHKVAGTPTKLMMFYKVLSSLAARYKYGLSATVHRSDTLITSTFAVIGDIVHEITEQEVGDKIIKANHVKIDTNLLFSENYLETDGMLNFNNLINYIAADNNRNLLIKNLIEKEKDQLFLVLSHRVEHCNVLKKLVGYGEVITGAIGKDQRQTAFEGIKTGNVRVIYATYALAKEGLDLPNLTRLILATPQKDFAIVKQSVGRIERNIDGKIKPIVYDLVDVNINFCVGMYKKRKNILK